MIYKSSLFSSPTPHQKEEKKGKKKKERKKNQTFGFSVSYAHRQGSS